MTVQAGAWRGLWPPRSAAEGSVGLGAGSLPAQLPGPRLRSPRAGAFQTLLLSRSRSPRPAWGQGSQAAGHRLHASVWGPSSGPPARPLCPPSPQETRPCFPFFSEAGVLGTYTLLGLLFLPALSLPVSMATPPNSRFQAAMTSPSPFLPPRPRGTAAGPGLQGCADPAQASPAPPKLWPQVCRPQVGPRPSEGPACPLRDPLHADHPAGAATDWGDRGSCPPGLGSLCGP